MKYHQSYTVTIKEENKSYDSYSRPKMAVFLQYGAKNGHFFFNFPGYFAHLLSSYSSRNLKEDYAGCTVTITEEKKGFIVIQGKKISILWLFWGKNVYF